MRTITICAAIAALALGCAGPDYEAERRREMFRTPDYVKPDKPSLDRAGQLSMEGSSHYFRALATDDPLEKKRLLRIAADRFQRALEEYQALRAITTDARRREDLSFIIMHIRKDLNDSIRQIPITGE